MTLEYNDFLWIPAWRHEGMREEILGVRDWLSQPFLGIAFGNWADADAVYYLWNDKERRYEHIKERNAQ